MERDRQKERAGTPESRAEPWSEFFGFSVLKTIQNSKGSIHVAVFEYNHQNTPHLGVPPRYVIAFRGTMLKRATWYRDVNLDIRSAYNRLHRGRYKGAITETKAIVRRHGSTGVWLAGHSLGAGLALLAGKNMARSGYPLESYIFNPPTASILLKVLKSKKLKSMVRFVGNITRAAIVKVTGHDKGQEDKLFKKLASWTPYLYVNPSDPICSEYIYYFKDRKKWSEMGFHTLVSLGTRYNFMNPFSRGGASSSDTEEEEEEEEEEAASSESEGEGAALSQPLHILPSAWLMTNTSNPSKRLGAQGIRQYLKELLGIDEPLRAHAIRQWWDPSSIVERELFMFDYDLASNCSSDSDDEAPI